MTPVAAPAFRTELDDGVLTLTIDRPPANAISLDLLDELRSHLSGAEASDAVGAVVITGAGRFFMAGGDIKLFPGFSSAGFGDYVRAAQSTFDFVESLTLPTIAAVNGPATGGGFELALACDLRFVAASASLSLPEVKLGLFPAAGGTQRLLRAVGKGSALDLLYTGRSLAPDEALALGLVERVVEPDRLLPEALAYARQLSAGPRQAHRRIKEVISTGLAEGPVAGKAAELVAVVDLHGSPDGREGVAAFVEKRPPVFGGRPERQEHRS